MQKLRERFVDTTPAKLGDEAFQTTDKYLGRLCFIRKGKYIAGYSDDRRGHGPRRAQRRSWQLRSSKRQWGGPRPPGLKRRCCPMQTQSVLLTVPRLMTLAKWSTT